MPIRNPQDIGSEQAAEGLPSEVGKAIKAFAKMQADFVSGITKQVAEMESRQGQFFVRMAGAQGRFSRAEQQNILPDFGPDPEDAAGGGMFSIRYRNDTATANPENVHRLEWIANATVIDPDTGVEWADELWTPIVNFIAVTVTADEPT